MQLVYDFVTNTKGAASLLFRRTRLSEIDNNVHKRPLAGKSKQAKSAACWVFHINQYWGPFELQIFILTISHIDLTINKSHFFRDAFVFRFAFTGFVIRKASL